MNHFLSIAQVCCIRIYQFSTDVVTNCYKHKGLKNLTKLFACNIQKMMIMASGPITSFKLMGETMEAVTDFIFGAPKSLQMVTAVLKLKDTYSLEEKLRQTWTA